MCWQCDNPQRTIHDYLQMHPLLNPVPVNPVLFRPQPLPKPALAASVRLVA